MLTPNLPPDEARRLARLAAQNCGTPVTLLALLDERRQ